MSHLNQIPNVNWKDEDSNYKVRKHANIPSVEAGLTQSQFRWTGHSNRMDDTRLPKPVFYEELQHGKRGVRCPKLRFQDFVKYHLSSCHISFPTAERDQKIKEHHSKDATQTEGRAKKQKSQQSNQPNLIWSMQAPVHTHWTLFLYLKLQSNSVLSDSRC